MAESRQRTTGPFLSFLVMVGLVMAGCMGVPQRPQKGGAGGQGPEDPGDPPPDAAVKKPDAKPTIPTTTEMPDADQRLDPRPDGAPDVKAGGDTASAPGDAGAAAATFTELWMTVFGTPAMQASSCAGAACHNPGVKDMVNLSSKAMAYATLTRNRGPVVKGDPAMSKLMTRLTSTNAMQRMPLGKPALSKELIDKVRAWIAAGANND